MTSSTGSTICLSPARVGIQWSPAFSRSLPVITASTPGIASASLASIDLIRAWAYGLRTMSIQTMFGRTTSSMYSPPPRMKRGSSLRFIECPMPATSGVVVGCCASSVIVGSSRSRGGAGAGLGRVGGSELGGGLLDGLDDVHVPRAPAQVARDPLADLLVGGLGVLLEEPRRLHD